MREKLSKFTQIMEEVAKHSGVVTAVEAGQVEVRMKVNSACGSCQAHAKCGFAESADKVVVIETALWQHYHVGDAVEVVISQRNGLVAVVLAYLLPAVLMIAVFIVMNSLFGELWAALGTLLFVVLYWGVLWCFRKRIKQRFSFRLQSLE